jgi:hypothetical protein
LRLGALGIKGSIMCKEETIGQRNNASWRQNESRGLML